MPQAGGSGVSVAFLSVRMYLKKDRMGTEAAVDDALLMGEMDGAGQDLDQSRRLRHG